MTYKTQKLGTKKAKSAPNVFGESIWFQGEDDLIWHMKLVPPKRFQPADPPPTETVNPQGLKTKSTPQPTDDGFVYFQSDDNKLIMMEQNFPHLYADLGVECYDAPAAPNDGYVYVRTGAGKLARVAVTVDEAGAVTRYDVVTSFSPAIHITASHAYAFVANSSYRLQRLDLDKPSQAAVNHGDFTLTEAPVMGNDGKLYVVDNKNDAYAVDPVSAAATKIAGNVKSAPVTSEAGDDGKVYWRAVGDALYMAPRSNTSQTTELGKTDARPDAQGDGYVMFKGEDDYIYRVSTTST
jgi:hypothetical protein